jgi:hypothetical protein
MACAIGLSLLAVAYALFRVFVGVRESAMVAERLTPD